MKKPLLLTNNLPNHFLLDSLKLIFLSLCLIASSFAQSGLEPKRGFLNNNPYTVGNVETINQSNGNLLINIPLAQLPPGRGGSPGVGVNLIYDSKIWNTYTYLSSYYGNGYTDVMVRPVPDGGGWNISYGYRLELIDKGTEYVYAGDATPRCPGNMRPGVNEHAITYLYKLRMKFPGGSSREFHPLFDINNAAYNGNGSGYYKTAPNGAYRECTTMGDGSPNVYIRNPDYRPRTYYTADGSRLRLEISYTQPSDSHQTWTLYFPDGTRVTRSPSLNGYNAQQEIIDRNGNRTVISSAGGVTSITDDVGRSITIDGNVSVKGVGAEELRWTISRKTIRPNKMYSPGGASSVGASPPQQLMLLNVVDQVTLPQQLGGLSYTFGYGAKEAGTDSSGLGEVKSITLPSGARSEYTYLYDSKPNLTYEDVLGNVPTRKDLFYAETYDGTTTPKIATWLYITGYRREYQKLPYIPSIIEPSGGVTTEGSIYDDSCSGTNNLSGVNNLSKSSDGTTTERTWLSVGSNPGGLCGFNPYVKTEYISIIDAANNWSQTAIKDYEYDLNGNVTQIREYDWVPYTSVPRPNYGSPTGIPANAPLKRVTVKTYYNPTPNITSNQDSPNAYWKRNSPLLKNLVKSVEIRDGAGTPVSRSEFVYDNSATAPTVGNLTEVKSWDSWKNGSSQAYSNPLTTANSVFTATQSDAYGNPTLVTDARGTQTKLIYGTIVGPSSAVTDLYPTETIAAFGTALARSSTAEYDFSTGLVKRATDINGTAFEMVYDALGRPLTSKAAVGTPQEVWSQTEYNDAARRIIVRSDLNTKGDAAKIGIQHFDQLGRVRLTRTLENPAQDPADEMHGIKVQTRYRYDNPTDPLNSNGGYSLTSNPYRAATSAAAGVEMTMGWTLSYSDKTGRTNTMKTFGGATLPAPFGGNSNLTGTVTTNVDADRTLVTDQAGKQRISQTNALGQLVKVWEIKAADADTVAVSFPNHAGVQAGLLTSYSYDTLNNLTTVNQGSQQRSFSYSSLSRLLTAINPELGTTPTNGTINYTYDTNGNLLTKRDARHITTTYAYDSLNRAVSRTYSDGVTPGVSYFYDGTGLPSVPAHSKGRLTKVSSSASETRYTAFDALGRIKSSQQITDGTTYDFADYSYNVSGALISQKYPSGRQVRYVLDADGDLAGVSSRTKATNPLRSYASNFAYTAHGAVSAMQLGNNRWETTAFSNRLQPTQLGLGTTAALTDLWRASFEYGTASTNNGNVTKQTIVVPSVTVGSTTYDGFTAVQTYTYDSLNRLQSAEEKIGTPTTWRQTFQYDRFGNRRFDLANTTRPATPADGAPKVINPEIDPATNRLKQTQYGEANSYLYDAAGNLTRDALGKRFAYDAENKQREFFDWNNGTTTPNAIYQYDGDGRRIKKTVGLETTIFVYDASGKLAAEYSTTAPPPPAQAQTSYLTADHLGSPRVISDQTGKVTSRRDFLPFGEDLSTPQRTAALGYQQDTIRQRYTGKERDSESGLDYFLARYYANQHGRFSSPDPLLSSGTVYAPQTWNRYSYTVNNPLKYIDPFGMYICDGDKKQCKNFEDGFKKAQDALKKLDPKSDQYKALDRSLKAYGAAGVDNGVTVKFGTNKTGSPAATGIGIRDKDGDGKKDVTADNPTGQDTTVTFDTSQQSNSSDYAIDIGHEGSHVADGTELIGALPLDLTDPAFDKVIGGPLNLTKYQTETRAYGVTAAVAQGLGVGSLKVGPKGGNQYEIWNSGWKQADRTTKQSQGIDKVLAEPKSKKGLYEVTPTNQGKKIIE